MVLKFECFRILRTLYDGGNDIEALQSDISNLDERLEKVEENQN